MRKLPALCTGTLAVLALFCCLASAADHSDWSEAMTPVADLWRIHIGYNVRSRSAETEPENGELLAAESFSKRVDNGGGPCVNTTDCDHGSCVNGTCLCDNGWAAGDCSYERKEKLTAFLLEFFTGAFTGAGSFYLGYIGQGVGKLVLYWGGCLLLCFGNAGAAFSKPCCGLAGQIITYILVNILASGMIIGVAIWCFVDWILILCDDLDDYNGYYLNGF